MPDLRPGQLRRLGRISENNPERAYRVADRMEKRASREDRGKEIADNAKKTRTAKEGVAKAVGRMVERQDSNPARREAIKKMTTAEGKGKQVGRDYPLSTTPEPKSFFD
jgi:hypothetical protein